jgi:hypothetical protein
MGAVKEERAVPEPLKLPKLESERECWFAIADLYQAIISRHGPAVTKRLFSEFVGSKRQQQSIKNDWLLARYIKSGLSMRRFAAIVAEQNESLPRDQQHGPNGSTNAESIATHIRRWKKMVDGNPRRRAYIENLAKHIADIS